jgi:hypothetical protein
MKTLGIGGAIPLFPLYNFRRGQRQLYLLHKRLQSQENRIIYIPISIQKKIN